MHEDEKEFLEMVNRLRIDASSNPAHRQRLKRQMLEAFGTSRRSVSVWSVTLRWGTRGTIFRYAWAALLLLGFGLVVYRLVPANRMDRTTMQRQVREEPAAALTLRSLRLVFSRSGSEGVEEQYDRFFRGWDPGQPKFGLLN